MTKITGKMKNMWNERYAGEEYIYGKEPNVFFKAQLLKRKAGKLLLPGEGEGRNAVYAALQGWDVTAFDSSNTGKEKAEKLAAQQNVHIEYHLSSYENAEYEENSFDVIALIYAHTIQRSILHKKLLDYLKPGGMIVLEGFSKEQLQFKSGGPNRQEMLFSAEEILSDFMALKNKYCQLEEVTLDEGSFHKGKASVIRFHGIK